jgi:hypothetical protein
MQTECGVRKETAFLPVIRKHEENDDPNLELHSKTSYTSKSLFLIAEKTWSVE